MSTDRDKPDFWDFFSNFITDLLKRLEALEEKLSTTGGSIKEAVVLEKALELENKTEKERKENEKRLSESINSNQDMNSAFRGFQLKLEERFKHLEQRSNITETETETKLLNMIIELENKTEDIERTPLEFSINAQVINNNTIQRLREKLEDQLDNLESKFNDSEIKNDIKSIPD